MSDLKAVLWDFGGVLTTSPFEAFARFERQRGLPEKFIRSINAANAETNAWARLESSRITLDEFDRAFAAEALAKGYEVRGREVIELLAGDLRPRMVEALKRCKARFKVACLTNNVRAGEGPSMARTVAGASAVQAVLDLFDHVIESSKEGMRKPDPAFYLLACDRLEVEPHEVVFLDDLGINLKPAAGLGMRTIKVVSEDQALADLEAIVGIDLTTDRR